MIAKLTEADCRIALRDGDFDPLLRGSAPLVVLALTQSWCPQWTRMRTFLEEFSTEEGCASYFLEYDREPFFDEFRRFKETVYRNDQVPYLRYYREGKLFKESNYLDKASFRKLLGLAPAVR